MSDDSDLSGPESNFSSAVREVIDPTNQWEQRGADWHAGELPAQLEPVMPTSDAQRVDCFTRALVFLFSISFFFSAQFLPDQGWD